MPSTGTSRKTPATQLAVDLRRLVEIVFALEEWRQLAGDERQNRDADETQQIGEKRPGKAGAHSHIGEQQRPADELGDGRDRRQRHRIVDEQRGHVPTLAGDRRPRRRGRQEDRPHSAAEIDEHRLQVPADIGEDRLHTLDQLHASPPPLATPRGMNGRAQPKAV
jgi:hypothetical protein